MNEKYLTSFLIGFSLMFTIHYLLDPTWGIEEQRPRSMRLIVNYVIGVGGIACAFLYLHPNLWLDLLVSTAGAGSATVLAHGRDWVAQLVKRDRANGLVEKSKDQA